MEKKYEKAASSAKYVSKVNFEDKQIAARDLERRK